MLNMLSIGITVFIQHLHVGLDFYLVNRDIGDLCLPVIFNEAHTDV